MPAVESDISISGLYARTWIQFTISPLLDIDYLNKLYESRNYDFVAIAKGMLHRVVDLRSSGRYDLLWIEKELFPWFPFPAEKIFEARTPYLVDYDDAIFHYYDIHPRAVVQRLLGRKIDAIMANAKIVTVGNEYLAERARRAGAPRVEILPSVIDLKRCTTGQGAR
jgi:hypothetical protein